MNKIHDAFLKGNVLAPFITCGDPDLETTAASVEKSVQNGAEMIVLGIPFSDPTAEAPLLQEASIRALKNGVNTDRVFGFMAELRKTVCVPVVFVTYANVVFSYGVERFMKGCSDAGVCGLLIPDLPYEEREDFLPECNRYGVELIAQLALNSEQRIEMIAEDAKGLICLSAKVCAGSTYETTVEKLGEVVERVRKITKTPCIIDFDLDDKVRICEIAAIADGVLVSSAIVQMQAQFGKNAPEEIGNCVKSLKQAI